MLGLACPARLCTSCRGIPLLAAFVSAVRRYRCGCTLSTPALCPRRRRIASIPLLPSLSCGLHKLTKSAGLLSVRPCPTLPINLSSFCSTDFSKYLPKPLINCLCSLEIYSFFYVCRVDKSAAFLRKQMFVLRNRFSPSAALYITIQYSFFKFCTIYEIM